MNSVTDMVFGQGMRLPTNTEPLFAPSPPHLPSFLHVCWQY